MPQPKQLFIVSTLLIALGLIALGLLGRAHQSQTPSSETSPQGLLLSPSPTQTASPSATNSPSATPSPSTTPSPSPTPTPSPSGTLAQPLRHISLALLGVTLAPSPTPFPDGLNILSEPPLPSEPLPDATLLPFPYTDFSGWVVFESDHPAMRYIKGSWSPLQSAQVSGGQYHYSGYSSRGAWPAVWRLSFH